MIKNIFNALSGRNRSWNKIREPYLRQIERRIVNSNLSETRQFYFPFLFGAIEIIDYLFGPHKKSDLFNVKTNQINDVVYSKLLNITTEGLIQIYLNTTSDPENVKESMKESYMIGTEKKEQSFDNLSIAEHSKFNDANLLPICTEVINKYRDVLNLKEGQFLEGYLLTPIISSNLQYVHQLRREGSLDSMFKY